MIIERNSTWSEIEKTAIQKRLTNTKILLEYGCGDLTELACEKTQIQKVVAVESNKALSDEVYQSVIAKEKLHMVYANIGEVDATGRPINDLKFKNFHTYMVLPWALADKYLLSPDTIFINGPFKVASFLYSLICAEEGTVILFNQFFSHPSYEIVRNYCALEKRHGEIAEFIVKKNYVMSDIAAQIAKYSVIPN